MSLDINNYNPAFKYGAQIQTDDIAPNSVTGLKTVWGSQTIVLSVHSTSTASAGATTQINIGAAAPAAATVKFVQIQPTNQTAAVWEIASTTNTKAFVISNPASNSTSSSLYVVGATSILNVALAAGEQLVLVSTTAGGSATVVVGLETAN
jgi:hypothetical protein